MNKRESFKQYKQNTQFYIYHQAYSIKGHRETSIQWKRHHRLQLFAIICTSIYTFKGNKTTNTDTENITIGEQNTQGSEQ